MISTRASPPAARRFVTPAASAAWPSLSLPAAPPARPANASRCRSPAVRRAAERDAPASEPTTISVPDVRPEFSAARALAGIEISQRMRKAGAADEERRRRSCRLASAIRCIMLGLGIADGDTSPSIAIRCEHGFEIATAHGGKLTFSPRMPGGSEHVDEIGIRIGVVALPDLGFFRAAPLNEDCGHRWWCGRSPERLARTRRTGRPADFRCASAAAVSAAGCPRSVESIFLNRARPGSATAVPTHRRGGPQRPRPKGRGSLHHRPRTLPGDPPRLRRHPRSRRLHAPSTEGDGAVRGTGEIVREDQPGRVMVADGRSYASLLPTLPLFAICCRAQAELISSTNSGI